MATTNAERVGKGLDLLSEGLGPYVEREMKTAHGASWREEAKRVLGLEQDWRATREIHLEDPSALLTLMIAQWGEVFSKKLGPAERSYLYELRAARNDWAHKANFTTDDADRALDNVHRLLLAVSAPQAAEANKQKQELRRVLFEEHSRQVLRRSSVAPVQGQPPAQLLPWREIVTPHRDVASGHYIQAEFAADLDQVHQGEAQSEYQDPGEFFQRTFLTEGLTHLLSDALTRLSGRPADPIVELQTNFGGGKTHSMLALYHLFSGTPASQLAGIEQLLKTTGVGSVPSVNRAVLVGTALSAGQARRKPDGTEVRTMWGELAWQLGDAAGAAREAFSLVAQDDAQGSNPGSQTLAKLLDRFSPSLILIDEWVAFVRQLYESEGLPAGSFDANLTFAQSLSEAVRQVSGSLLVASVPQSAIEMGGEAGKITLDRLANIFGRMGSTWRPATAEEGFQIVRRRLFEPISDPKLFAARDAVIQGFSKLYRTQAAEFPNGCGEASYERRLTDAYPIHPELFDRLYGDWSTLEKFQRTRGVLRLMATVIHTLWEREDRSLLILPANVPIDADTVRNELTRYLDDPWLPVIERDVDGPQSLPLSIDNTHPNLGRYSATRRVARTIYMGSAPTLNTKQPGIDDRHIKLGSAQPGENVPIFGDALRRLEDQAMHLYADGPRYWFSTQQSVTSTALGRAAQYSVDDVWHELRQRLLTDKQRGDFAGVHVAPASGANVEDEAQARLVILDPECLHSVKETGSPARERAVEILTNRSSGPRIYRNMLVFLAPDRARRDELEQAIRQYLAWKSIENDREKLNLDTFQSKLAESRCKSADETVRSRILETYCWLIWPLQRDATGQISWDEARLQGQDALAVRASRKLKNDGLLVTQFGGALLRMELDKFLWRESDHIGVKRLWEYFAQYLYLTRLRDQSVLLDAIRDGVGMLTWEHETFAYAQAFDEARARYVGLTAGTLVSPVMDPQSVIVKPEKAREQLEEDAKAAAGFGSFSLGTAIDHSSAGQTAESGTATNGNGALAPTSPKALSRFHGTVPLRAKFVTGDAGKVADEIIQHLTSVLGAEVDVTLEIQAHIPGGAPDNIVRIVMENARTLKFSSQGFEEE